MAMPFLHIFLNVGRTERYEFGFNSECPPCVGDVVDLFFRRPDTIDSGAQILECRVVKRQWFLGYYANGDDDVCELTVETNDPIPEGYVPDSKAWPSETWSERKSLLRQITEELRQG